MHILLLLLLLIRYSSSAGSKIIDGMLLYDRKTIKSIVRQLMNFNRAIRIHANTDCNVSSLISYLRDENSILFHLGKVNYIFYPKLKEAILHPDYTYTKKEYEMTVVQLVAAVEKMRNQICTANSVYERELRIHDSLCLNVIYADEGDRSHSIVGPLLYRKGVCDGISKTAKVLFQECSIKSHIIRGKAISVDGQYVPHAWNIVYINGIWYHLDITFDNTLSEIKPRYDYFNLSTEKILKDHIYETNIDFNAL